MKVRAIQWRAVVLPAGVALVATLALVWFNFVHIPTTERYLNDRNLRLLRTISSQIKSRVDNLDQAIDNALDSLESDEAAGPHFGDYVKLFAPEIEILKLVQDGQKATRGSFIEDQVLEAADDPPRIMIQRDEGHNFLYLGSKHKDVKVLARVDIEKVAAEYFPAEDDFDALFLVDPDGRAIAGRSASGIELARVDKLKLVTSTAGASGSSDSNAGGVQSDEPFESVRTTSTVRKVWLGDAVYQMFIQPVQLSLPRATGKAGGPGVPAEWALCGLVDADHFRTSSSAISYTAMLWFGAVLAAICIAIPLLKLQLLNANERLRRSDGVIVAVTAYVAAAALSFGLLDVYEFGLVQPKATDTRLGQVAEGIARRLKNEVADINRQMDRLEMPEVWANELKYDQEAGEDNLNLEQYRRMLSGARLDPPQIVWTAGSPEWAGSNFDCRPTWACRQQVLSRLTQAQIAGMPYPYFELSSWDDAAGQQRIKWATSAVTPFLNVKVADLPYFASMSRARLLADPAPPKRPAGVSVFLSPNTGKRVTVFWRAITDNIPKEAAGTDLIGQALSANPLALDQPVLPGGMQFAVVDGDGLVLFHSDPTRSLKENFIQECENSLALRSLILEKRPGALTASYRARSHQLFVMPLELGSFGTPDWSLIVFQNTIASETANLYTLMLATRLLGAYAIFLAIGWAAMHLILRRRHARWFWPDPDKGDRYRVVAGVNAALAVIAIAAARVPNPTWALIVTALAVAAAPIASYGIMTSNVLSRAERPSWQRDFIFARTSLLLVLAAVPALVCFRISYEFEMALVHGREQMRLALDSNARDARIQQRRPPAGLCGRDYENGRSCPNFSMFLDQRKVSERSWDQESPPSSVWQAASTPAASDPTPLESLLRKWQLPINDVGVDLAAVAAIGNAPSATAPGWWWIILIPAFLVALYGLSRFVAQRFFVLDLYGQPPSFPTEHSSEQAASLLLIGPPGSGKTARLQGTPEVRTFDVRTLAYVERRKRVCATPVERRLTMGVPSAFATEPQGAQGPFVLSALQRWPDWTTQFVEAPQSSDPAGVVGIDHLEYRLDDPKFRDQILDALEDLLFRQERKVWVASTCDPIDHLRDGTIDLDRWSRVFQSFRKRMVGIGNASAPNGLADEMGEQAEPYYRSLWSACSIQEKLALRHLADEGVVSARNQPIVADLMRKGLVVRRDGFRLMNGTFRRFVARAEPAETIAAWEREGVGTPWASVRTALVTCVFAFGGFLILTEQQLVGTLFGVVPTLLPAVVVPAVPTFINLLASRASKKTIAA